MMFKIGCFLFGLATVALSIFILFHAIKDLYESLSQKYQRTPAHCIKYEKVYGARNSYDVHIILEYDFDFRHIISDKVMSVADVPRDFQQGSRCDVFVNYKNPEDYYFSRKTQAANGISLLIVGILFIPAMIFGIALMTAALRF